MIGSQSLTELAQNLNGRLIGAETRFSRVSIDTRTIQPDDLYVALEGARFDGNDFLPQAKAGGAGAALVSSSDESISLPQLLVPDTHHALGVIAAENRSRSGARIFALTGSQGKTTVKEMAAAILAAKGSCLHTKANLNNTIGVPLTLLQIDEPHEYAVIEMGANKAGEIAFSAGITKADIVMITNANDAHLEGFGSLQGIVQAKGEILDNLSPTKTAVLNGDDPNVGAWIERAAPAQVVLFGYSGQNGNLDYYAREVRSESAGQVSFTIVGPELEARISMSLPGQHNVVNAVAAAAAADVAGAEHAHISAGLAGLAPVKGRLFPRLGISESRLIDDTYNASPGSFKAAIDVLVSLPGEKFLLAGDMKELGAGSKQAHREIGEYARRQGVNQLWAVGDHCKEMVAGFGAQGRHFSDQQELIAACRSVAGKDVVFLVKGSRGSQMEVIALALEQVGEQ